MSNEDAISMLEARVRVMRKLGVTKWGDIELGTEPQPEAKVETQHEEPEALEKRRRASQHATSMSAVGRLVPRLGGND